MKAERKKAIEDELRIMEEIKAEAPENAPPPTHQQVQAKRLEALALQHSSIPLEPVSAAQLARDIYETCQWMQANMPYNAMTFNIQKVSRADGKDLRLYWMQDRDALAKQALDGILFYTESGKRRHDNFYGWGLCKNPILKSEKIGKELWEWERRWAENFGYLNPDIAEEIKARQAAIEEANKRIVTRRHNYFWLENKETFQIAQMMAVANLMGMWLWQNQWAALVDTHGDVLAWLRSIWVEQARIMELELEYRTEADPQPRSSKKKTEAAKADFRKAAIFLAGGTTELYSEDFIKMVEKTEFPIDFSLDPEALPKQKPEKEPVMRMSSTKLMAEFVRWVTDAQIDPDSFEAEDALVLKRRVSKAVTEALDDERKALARAKGQKVHTLGVESQGVGDE
jgi:hypothetical protein